MLNLSIWTSLWGTTQFTIDLWTTSVQKCHILHGQLSYVCIYVIYAQIFYFSVCFWWVHVCVRLKLVPVMIETGWYLAGTKGVAKVWTFAEWFSSINAHDGLWFSLFTPPFIASLVSDPSFGFSVHTCSGEHCVPVKVNESITLAMHSADSRKTMHDGSVRGFECIGWRCWCLPDHWNHGGTRGPEVIIFCLSSLMAQRRIKRDEMGQNGSRCERTGMKRDQTAELNSGIIVPEFEGHCFRILSPTRSGKQILRPCHWVRCGVWSFNYGPRVLQG